MLKSDFLPVQDGHVRLRRLRARDAEAFAEGAADSAVRKFGHLPETKYTAGSVRRMIKRDVIPGLVRGNLAVLAIAEAKTDAFAGSLVLFNVSERSAEVGFWVHTDYRGSKVAVTALKLATHFAQASGLLELTARTLPENPASQHTLEAAGFTFEESRIDTAPSGNRVELLHYSHPLLEAMTT